MSDLIEKKPIEPIDQQSFLDAIKNMLDKSGHIQNNEIAKALGVFQESCPSIPQNTQGYGYKYSDLKVITETIKPHLKKAKLSYTHKPYRRNDEVGVVTTIMHGESGQEILCQLSASMEKNNQKSMSQIQVMGSLVTYLKRYTLSALLGIVTEEDTDGAIAPSKKSNTSQKTNNTDVTWLSEAQFKSAMKADIKGIEATIKAFSSTSKKMKKEYKEQLTAQLENLKKSK